MAEFIRPIKMLALVGGILAALAPASRATPEAGRNYLIRSWQTDEGLPQNWVSSISQTPDGYLWVGTRYGGLARFDGERFVHFNQQNTAQIRDVQVEHLSADETGRLWIVMGNESVSTFQGGHFELVRTPRSEPRIRLDHVLMANSNQVLFAGEFPYLAALHPAEGGKWERYDPPPALTPDPNTFTLDRDGVVWFVTQDNKLGALKNNKFSAAFLDIPSRPVRGLALDALGALHIAFDTGVSRREGTQLVPLPGIESELGGGIRQIAFAGDGGLWIVERTRIRKFLKGHLAAEIAGLDWLESVAAGPFALHGDSHGDAWLVSNGRGLLHCKSDGTAHLLTEKTGLPSRFVTCWFQDAEGNIWIGLQGGGIARIRERVFQVYGQDEGLPDKVVGSVCVDGTGNLWVGTMSGGLARWQENRFVSVPLSAPENNPYESITVFPNREGGMWVGSLNHGLLQYKSGRFSPARLPWDNVRVLFDDSQNHLWVGGLVNLLNVSGDRRTEFGQQEGFVDGHAIGAVAEDAAGTIWVGTGPGELWRYAGGRFTRFEPPADWPSVRFAAVLPDTNGVVWVGTLGGGLYRFENGRFARCGATDGLPDNNVTQLLDSRDGFIWGGTYNGIFRARKEDLAAAAASGAGPVPCRVFGKSDGLPSLECSSGFQPCCWRSEDGRLWFSTANGVAAVDPAKILLNPTPPMVIVEEMLVNGSPVPLTPHIGGPLRPANPPPRIRIPPGRAYVQFRFTGLNFAAPDAVRFRLKLDGGGGTWQDTGHQRLMSYGPLAPGDYVFRVMAANNEGIWNEQGDTLAFTVEPYLWEEPWFRAGLVAVALACMGIIVAIVQRQRYRRRLDRVDRQREMEHERARIAHDLHDDLGANLTQIGILSALANRESTPAGEARDLIREVRTRAREMVIALDEIVWAVNPRNDSLGGLVNYLGHFAEEFFRPSDIRFRMDLPADLPPVPLSSESRHHVFLAFKEAVNNAARHSHAREANMRAWTDNSELVIALEDDGRGFDAGAAAKKGAGNGLGIMKLRLEKVGGRTVIRGGAGGGSCVEFHVPLKNS